jgi:hypothetical protein
MAEKTPHELLRESLERNAAEVAGWPSWLRSAISTRSIFSVGRVKKDSSDEGLEGVVPMEDLGFTSR